jgi:RNA polymerase sigma factor (sigma-70 family)
MRDEWLAERFEADRDRLRAVAYRLLGSTGEADDAVQEAWLRLRRADVDDIENLGGWLTTVVGRVCLNMLRSRGTRREAPLDTYATYVPDPVVSAADGTDPEQEALLADSVGLALLVVLETLGPAERLAFVLHDLFGVPFDEIAPVVAARGYRVLVPYLRGYGPTRFINEQVMRSGQQAALAKDLLDFMDALSIEKATLVGYDWGGRAACIVAALWPERVRGLVTGDDGFLPGLRVRQFLLQPGHVLLELFEAIVDGRVFSGVGLHLVGSPRPAVEPHPRVAARGEESGFEAADPGLLRQRRVAGPVDLRPQPGERSLHGAWRHLAGRGGREDETGDEVRTYCRQHARRLAPEGVSDDHGRCVEQRVHEDGHVVRKILHRDLRHRTGASADTSGLRGEDVESLGGQMGSDLDEVLGAAAERREQHDGATLTQAAALDGDGVARVGGPPDVR